MLIGPPDWIDRRRQSTFARGYVKIWIRHFYVIWDHRNKWLACGLLTKRRLKFKILNLGPLLFIVSTARCDRPEMEIHGKFMYWYR